MHLPTGQGFFVVADVEVDVDGVEGILIGVDGRLSWNNSPDAELDSVSVEIVAADWEGVGDGFGDFGEYSWLSLDELDELEELLFSMIYLMILMKPPRLP